MISNLYVLEIQRFVEDPNGFEESPPLDCHYELVGIYTKDELYTHMKKGLPIPENPHGNYWPAHSWETNEAGVGYLYTTQSCYCVRPLNY